MTTSPSLRLRLRLVRAYHVTPIKISCLIYAIKKIYRRYRYHDDAISHPSTIQMPVLSPGPGHGPGPAPGTTSSLTRKLEFRVESESPGSLSVTVRNGTLRKLTFSAFPVQHKQVRRLRAKIIAQIFTFADQNSGMQINVPFGQMIRAPGGGLENVLVF